MKKVDMRPLKKLTFTLVIVLLLSITSCQMSTMNPILVELTSEVRFKTSYRSDLNAWGVEEYWQSPEETRRLGTGDCEDYALLLMEEFFLATGQKANLMVGFKGVNFHAVVEHNGYFYDASINRYGPVENWDFMVTGIFSYDWAMWLETIK